MWYYKLKKTANKKRGGEGGAIFSIERPTLLSELEINLLLTIGSSTVLLNTILTGYLSRFTVYLMSNKLRIIILKKVN